MTFHLSYYRCLVLWISHQLLLRVILPFPREHMNAGNMVLVTWAAQSVLVLSQIHWIDFSSHSGVYFLVSLHNWQLPPHPTPPSVNLGNPSFFEVGEFSLPINSWKEKAHFQ